MNHEQVRRRLADYLDGGIPLDQRARVDAHLDACEPCTREVSELRATIGLLRRLPEPELPAHLADDVLRRIRTGELRIGLLDRVRDWLSELATPGVAVPATALVAAFAVAIGSGQFRVPGFEAPASAIDIAKLPAIPPEAQEMVQRIFVRTPEGIRAPSAFTAADHAPLPAGPARIVDATPVAAVGRSTGTPLRVIARSQGEAVLWGGSPSRVGDRAPRTADDWLEVLLQRPDEFARSQASQPLAAREHWVRALAQRAVERGIADRVVEVLRSSVEPESEALAEAFAAEAGLPSAQVAAPR